VTNVTDRGDRRHARSVSYGTDAVGARPYRLDGRAKEVARMLTGEIAKHRIEERISESASARSARGVGARRAAERRMRTRRLVGVATALLSLPFKH
jgi:hypothetical protein